MQCRFKLAAYERPADRAKFVEYDSRAHRLNTLASFSFWVSSNPSRSDCPFNCSRKMQITTSI
jgi:hypothetical protein